MAKRKIKANSLEQPPTKRVSLRKTKRTRPYTPGSPEATSTAKRNNPSSSPPTLHLIARQRDTSPPIVTVHATDNGVQLLDHCLLVTEHHPNSSSHLPLSGLSNHADVSTTRSPPRKKRGRPPRRVVPDHASHMVSSPLPERRGTRPGLPLPTETNPARQRDTHQDANPDSSQPVYLCGESQALPPPVETDSVPHRAACQTSLAPDAVVDLPFSTVRQIERQRPPAAEADYSSGPRRGVRRTRPPPDEEDDDSSPTSHRGARRRRPLVEEDAEYSSGPRRGARRTRPAADEEDDDSSPASHSGARRTRPPPIIEDNSSSPVSRGGARRKRPPLVEDGADTYDSFPASRRGVRRARPSLVEDDADSFPESRRGARRTRSPPIEDAFNYPATHRRAEHRDADSSTESRRGTRRARPPPFEEEFNYPPASRRAERRARLLLFENDADSSPESGRGARRARPPPVEDESNFSPASQSRGHREKWPRRQHFDNYDNVADVNYKKRNYSNNYKVDVDESGDAITRLAKILGNTMKNLQRSSIENSYSYSTRISEKKLPTFDGDPLDWIHFRQTFESSSKLGRYSDKENVSRLFDALKGEARRATKTLFASGNSSTEIMKTLEFRFGKTRIILEKIVTSIKELPRVDSGKIDLIEFASKLKNAVDALKTLKSTGYLCSPEFIKEVMNKIPKSMLHDYARYVKKHHENISPLENISNFLLNEAEMAEYAGIVGLHEKSESHKRRHHDEKVESRKRHHSDHHSSRKDVVLATQAFNNQNRQDSRNQTNESLNQSLRCVYCNFSGHTLEVCKEFVKEPMRLRWKFAKKFKICFNCLEQGHERDKCKGERCSHCGRNHHRLLHFQPRNEEMNRVQQVKDNNLNSVNANSEKGRESSRHAYNRSTSQP